MTKPLIGVTTERWSSSIKNPNRRVVGQLDGYVDALLGAGGIPILIPALPDDDLRELCARLDALVFSGGGDVDPAVYNAEAHPETNSIDQDRDRTELLLVRQALDDAKPVLGICRGLQVLNVAGGGTLYQDLPSEYPQALRHSFGGSEFGLDYAGHEVQIEEDSLLARCVGLPILKVNSRHHQAVKDVAPGWHIVARAPDGVVEGIERPDLPFAVAVQWHPENLQARPEMKALFTRLVAEARKHA
jgi:putative glutamine amidotransferase